MSSASVSQKSDADSEWKDEVVEPDFEFDETGLELEAHDAELEAEEGSIDEYLANLPADYRLRFSSLFNGTELARDEREAGAAFRSGAITPDGYIDEDFEEELGSPLEDDANDLDSDFRDIAKYSIISLAGDDYLGRKVIVFSSCRLPPSCDLDHQRLLQYLKHTLNQYVENDYTLVYFHHGLSSKNKPSFAWLRQAYREFDRKYKKNLKALYLVHPTNFIKILWGIFRPIISVKFGRKVMYMNYLHELAQHLPLDQLMIPQRVRDHDAFLLAKNKPTPVPTSIVHAPLPTQQFGVTLQFIKQNNHHVIPPIMQQSCSYLRDNGLETEGLFRRSAQATVLRTVQERFDKGLPVNFDDYSDIHMPAAILKSFLRQLPEPLLTIDLYDHIVRVQLLAKKERIEEMKRILHDELLEDNYFVLKYLIQFLTEVAFRSRVNLMTAQNLAIVFGPNLMWSKSQTSLAYMTHVNACAHHLIEDYHSLFTK